MVKETVKDVDLLKLICKSADMGQASIAHVIKLTDDDTMHRALEIQREEYQKSFDEAEKVLDEIGEGPRETASLEKAMSYVMSSMKTMTDNSPSKIAELLIEGSTMGITKMTQHLNDYDGDNDKVRRMAEKQIRTEQANIEEMKQFL